MEAMISRISSSTTFLMAWLFPSVLGVFAIRYMGGFSFTSSWICQRIATTGVYDF